MATRLLRRVDGCRLRIEGRNGDTIPEPGQNDCGGLAEAGRKVDKQRAAFAASGQRFRNLQARVFSAREAALVAKGLFKACRRPEKCVVLETHRSPPGLGACKKMTVVAVDDCVRCCRVEVEARVKGWLRVSPHISHAERRVRGPGLQGLAGRRCRPRALTRRGGARSIGV